MSQTAAAGEADPGLATLTSLDPAIRAASVPEEFGSELCKHATEEMAILAGILPKLCSRLAIGK